MASRLSSFLAECKRVLMVTRKPSKREFWDLVKITGIGLLVIGFMGFIVSYLNAILFQ